MEDSVESAAVAHVKATLRGYMAKHANLQKPAKSPGATLSSKAFFTQPIRRPYEAQLLAHQDAARSEINYNSIVALHSRYAPDSYHLDIPLIPETLDAMSTMTLFKLPPELRNKIYEHILPHSRLIITRKTDRSIVQHAYRGYGDPFWAPGRPVDVFPAIFHVCQQIRAEALPIYVSRQGWLFRHNARDLNYQFGPILQRSAFRKWAMYMKPGVKYMRKLGILLKLRGFNIHIHYQDGKLKAGVFENWSDPIEDVHERINKGREAFGWFWTTLQSCGFVLPGGEPELVMGKGFEQTSGNWIEYQLSYGQ